MQIYNIPNENKNIFASFFIQINDFFTPYIYKV